MRDLARLQALENIVDALDFTRCLPEMVYRKSWCNFLFFPSDTILFGREFFAANRKLLAAENAEVSCLLNVSQSPRLTLDAVQAEFLDESTDEDRYIDRLWNGKNGEMSWVAMVDTFACMSNIGGWCVYCEKENDVALVGFRNPTSASKFVPIFQEIWARPLAHVVKDAHFSTFPFNHLTEEWSRVLGEHYASKPCL